MPLFFHVKATAVSFLFLVLVLFFYLCLKKNTLFIAQLSFLDAVCYPGISRTNYLKPHVKQCCYLDSPWYYNIVTYTNRNLALYRCLYICIIYIYTCIYMIYICKWKVIPKDWRKKTKLILYSNTETKRAFLKLYNGIVLGLYKKVFSKKCFLY